MSELRFLEARSHRRATRCPRVRLDATRSFLTRQLGIWPMRFLSSHIRGVGADRTHLELVWRSHSEQPDPGARLACSRTRRSVHCLGSRVYNDRDSSGLGAPEGVYEVQEEPLRSSLQAKSVVNGEGMSIMSRFGSLRRRNKIVLIGVLIFAVLTAVGSLLPSNGSKSSVDSAMATSTSLSTIVTSQLETSTTTTVSATTARAPATTVVPSATTAISIVTPPSPATATPTTLAASTDSPSPPKTTPPTTPAPTQPTPTVTPTPATTQPSTPPDGSTVRAGSYCSPTGSIGTSATGIDMTCASQKCDGTAYDRPRWRQASC